MNWTSKQEARLRELTREAKELEALRGAAFDKLRAALDCIPIDSGYITTDSVEHVIRNADTLRDLLEPFDSGCREAVRDQASGSLRQNLGSSGGSRC